MKILAKQKIALVGLGPHAKRIYYSFIKKLVENGGVFSVLIELESKKNVVEEFFTGQDIKPNQILYVVDRGQITPSKISEELKKRMDSIIGNKEITHAIIATEPKAHKIYLDYFLKNHIPCLVDKPITAPIGLSYNKSASLKLEQDVKELIKTSNKNKTQTYVQVQRREHPAYIFIFKTLREIVEKYKVPITYFNIYHSDGTWSMPSEFLSRENHPYKYGYGKMMHSGYHFVDLVAWIVETNKLISDKITVETTANLLKPETHYNQINGSKLYKKIFKEDTVSPKSSKFGEIDAYLNFSFYFDKKVKKNNLMTRGNLDLLQSGFSKRSCFAIAKDTYKGNGRVRHEYLNINVGPLCNIQLHSYQANELKKGDLFGVGGEEHLDVYIFKNNDIIGGKPCEIIDFGGQINDQAKKFSGVYLGQNELARYTIFDKFLRNKSSDATIGKQLITNKLLAAVYKSAVQKKKVLTKI
ncbi:MAG: hypothetical protein A2556_00480 [Candidatus Vogelbacteria bacterium RIFOXYD2_FULL_44_9]|uniref:Gfo/Idh/MocA-like oxidoreductase N-terminal domain-containing protein n=2 Tax=Patescibacteria group TaxID=1783273 RepID=A0A0G0UUT0_9BACT|nr:MAG: hypothetical protein UU42_C0016G0010 [Candidatus Woesebacteria bacterium GW2011_GWA1_41_13b]OHA60864.1 MAG: hypothetical protein A2556_00480 [Candidatus Vogelbacteria bacterium RIFOXYD2_FULL_44_9]